jgi:sphingomyelin phosphodiesterase 2
MTVIRDHASLSDAWEATHFAPSPSIASTSSLSPTRALELYGVTADSPLNTYSAGKSLDAHARTFRGKRLDYILFRDPAPMLAPAARAPTLVAADTRVLLTDTVPGLPYSYSDHFGVSATLHIEYPRDGPNHATSPGDEFVPSAQRQTPLAISTNPFTPPDPARDSAELTAADATAVLEALATCSRHAHARAKRHLLIFGFSVGTLVALVAAAGRFPAEATPFVVLGSAVATWLGTTMLYVGFVYGRWEVNALQNVIEELELYRRGVEDVATAGE